MIAVAENQSLTVASLLCLNYFVLAMFMSSSIGIWSIGFLSKLFSIHTAFYFLLFPMIVLSILLVSYDRFANSELEL